jgi:hypothetical protein
MRWSKLILAIQAIIVLIIGIALLNIVILDDAGFDLSNLSLFDATDQGGVYQNIQNRFYNSSYILVTVSLIELILIWRLLK